MSPLALSLAERQRDGEPKSDVLDSSEAELATDADEPVAVERNKTCETIFKSDRAIKETTSVVGARKKRQRQV